MRLPGDRGPGNPAGVLHAGAPVPHAAVPPQGAIGGSRGGPGPEPAGLQVVFLESVLENLQGSTLTNILTEGLPDGTARRRSREGALLKE